VGTIELDFSRYGSSEVIPARLFPDERADLVVGDAVLLSGDTVDPQSVTIIASSDDGREFTFRRL
jgi:hypothetical protein